MRYFCTYFDQRYLNRGLALYESLRQWCPEFRLYVLCLDRLCYQLLSKLDLPEVRLIPLADLEAGDVALLAAKSNRSVVEYYFTSTPNLLLHILNAFGEVDLITYLDSDLFIFSDLSPVFREIDDCSIAIVEHRFSKALGDLGMYGLYNVGWLSFRRDQTSLACLLRWRQQCLEWCFARAEDNRYADQKYLDDWPRIFPRVKVVQHKGANVAPWNLLNYRISHHGGQVWVDDQPLVFYHFHAMRQINGWLFDPTLQRYQVTPTREVRRYIYGPYIAALAAATRRTVPLLRTLARSPTGETRSSEDHSKLERTDWPWKNAARGVRSSIKEARHLLEGQYIVSLHGSIL